MVVSRHAERPILQVFVMRRSARLFVSNVFRWLAISEGGRPRRQRSRPRAADKHTTLRNTACHTPKHGNNLKVQTSVCSTFVQFDIDVLRTSAGQRVMSATAKGSACENETRTHVSSYRRMLNRFLWLPSRFRNCVSFNHFACRMIDFVPARSRGS